MNRELKLNHLLFLLLVLVSCSSEVNREDVVFRDGKAYAVNSEKPFSGVIVSGGTKELTKQEYLNGIKQGSYLRYHANGQLAEEGAYDNGYEVGKHFEYFQNGKIQSLREFDEIGNPISIYRYFMNGDVKYKNVANQETGISTYEEFDDQGNIIIKENFKKGKKDGYSFIKEKRGNVTDIHEYFYKNGEPHGESTTTTDGILRSKINWKEGEFVGDYEKYDADGRLIQKGIKVFDKDRGYSVFDGAYMQRDFDRLWSSYGVGVKTICKNDYTSDFEPYLFDKDDPSKILFSVRYEFKKECDDVMDIDWSLIESRYESQAN